MDIYIDSTNHQFSGRNLIMMFIYSSSRSLTKKLIIISLTFEYFHINHGDQRVFTI